VYLVALPAAHNFPLACPGMLDAMSVGATTVFTTDTLVPMSILPTTAVGKVDKKAIVEQLQH
jgi:mycobactin salicyl-AMP ligase